MSLPSVLRPNLQRVAQFLYRAAVFQLLVHVFKVAVRIKGGEAVWQPARSELTRYLFLDTRALHSST
eukprot:8761198-Pyramimonas_sp.AAC.2